MLIVDDDADTLEEYCESATRLGYDVVGVLNPVDALQRIAEDETVGLVITDLEMPAIGGIAFLDELSSRFSQLRPLIPIVITGHGSLTNAVEAMRFNAKDFLTKQVSSEALAGALRRATRTWQDLYASFRLMALARQGERIERTPAAGDAPPLSPEEERTTMLEQVRSIMRTREKRGNFLDAQLFADPTWDILLDLTAARLEGKPIPVSSACAATNVSLSTALRHVRGLVDAGMVRRWKDTEDRRRDMLELDDRTMEAMTRYLANVRRRGLAGG